MTTHERLTTRILNPSNATPSPEDIFSSALEILYTDDTQLSHGVPGQSIIYRSPRFGDVYLKIPSHPDEEGGRKLFAHYLWNAGVIAAEGIERGSCDDDDGVNGNAGCVKCDDTVTEGEAGEMVQWDQRFWDMRGLDILELGAATALPSLIAALSNANSVISTDHPSSPAITTDAIESNFTINVTNRGSTGAHNDNSAEPEFIEGRMPKLIHPPVSTNTQVSVYGYTWGTETFYNTRGYGTAVARQPELRSFDRIVIADCLWMPSQHVNLVRSVLSYLKEHALDDASVVLKERSIPCAIVLAGFHTGREIVKDFIEIATGSAMGDNEVLERESGDVTDADVRGKLRAIDVFEVDTYGQRRAWRPLRPNETKEQLKRWCICAILTRR